MFHGFHTLHICITADCRLPSVRIRTESHTQGFLLIKLLIHNATRQSKTPQGTFNQADLKTFTNMYSIVLKLLHWQLMYASQSTYCTNSNKNKWNNNNKKKRPIKLWSHCICAHSQDLNHSEHIWKDKWGANGQHKHHMFICLFHVIYGLMCWPAKRKQIMLHFVSLAQNNAWPCSGLKVKTT